MRHARKWLILSHRYLGIALGAVFMMWFASGLVMIYAGGMPQLDPEVRRESLAPLATTAIRLSPAEAAERAGVTDVERASLTTVLGRPAYRFGRTTTVFADNGDLLQPIDQSQAQAVAARFLDRPAGDISFVDTVRTPDQWTMTMSRALPLLKFRTPENTQIYVSPGTADVVLATTSRDRLLAWVGVIPHFLYFAPLRLNQPLWYSVVVWLAEIGVAVALLGLVLGVVRFKRTRPFDLMQSFPYTGWMRWHVVLGAVFGVFTLTWVFSGLMSMEPWAWTNARGLELEREVLSGGGPDLTRFPTADPRTWAALAGDRAIKEVELTTIQDEPYYVVRLGHPARAVRRERLHQPYLISGREEGDRLLVSPATMTARSEAFSTASIVARLREAVPEAAIAEQTLLTEYDDYYYSRRGLTPLPVLRVKFDDPMRTWVYVDPEMSQILAQVHRLNRVERWLYNGLHSLDFAFWYRSRLWDVGIIVLCLGGLVASTIGTVMGFGRVARGVRAVTPSLPGSVPSTAASSKEVSPSTLN
jgi:hypothetical protein